MGRIKVQKGYLVAFHRFLFREYHQGHVSAEVLASALSECESIETTTSSEEITRSDSERDLWLHVVDVVHLLARVSRGEMSQGVRIRESNRPRHLRAHTQAALQAQLEAQAQVPAPQADHGGPSIMERFKRMSPPSFKGERDPLLAESWTREIEKIFRAIRCAEDDKVTLATYMLQERADVWWSSQLRTRF
ncbi:hypothetical protein Taro_006056 [Colocasia esculenta]|uniref:Uncharacterized protein n=1 Tax=Colocasia esculenta TaxID=4460 RepID=A0A843TW04_COLES|nr:hypothetical protein [Colocasia esculenta]